MKKLLVITCCLFISMFSLSQTDDAQIIEKNGINYYKHIVSKGETAYGISRKYNILNTLMPIYFNF